MSLIIVPTLSGDAVTTHNYSIVFPIREVDYLFTFGYSARMGRWTLNIETPRGEAVVSGAVVVNNVDLFSYADPALRPRGFLRCTWRGEQESAKEPTEKDLGAAYLLLYYEREEDLGDGLPYEAANA